MRDSRSSSHASGRVESLLDAARHALRDVPRFDREREEELVEAILSRTTRSTPRNRGARTWWISFAAALLVTSAGALVVASRGTRDLPARVAAALPPAAGPGALAPLEHGEPAGKARASENPLAFAREELVATASAEGRPKPGVDGDAPLELRLLEARAKGLRERRWDPWLREVALTDLDTLSLALWCEVELDRYVLSGSRPPGWNRAVEILERDLARPETPEEGSRLLNHALERAREYGLTDGVAVARLDAGAPLWNGQWFDDLDAAGREAGIAENGVWRAWVDWRGR